MYNQVGQHYYTRQIVLDAYRIVPHLQKKMIIMSHHEPIDFTFDSPQEIGYEQNSRNSGGSGGGGNFVTAIIGYLIEAIGGLIQGWRNRRAQRIENEKDRQFNAEQAEINRQWQEEQYKKYESVAAQMQQRQQAGLNPNEQIQAMSVGSGSTASSSSHSLPPISADFSLFSQIPSMIANLQLTKAETENIKQKTATERVEGMRKAVELNDYMAFREYYLEGLKHDTKTKEFNMKEAEANARKAFDDARIAHVNANNAEGAAAAGINPIIDGHNLTEAQIQHYMKQKEEADARIRNLNVDTYAKEFALSLSKIYDAQFLKLQLSERETQVREFLDTSDVRVGLQRVQQYFAKFALDEATRQDALNQITNEYEKHIAEQILNSARDGNTSFDAVILKSFTENPGSTLNAIVDLFSIFK